MKQKCPGLRSRRRRTPQQRTELLTQYRRSGLSQRDFVKSHGLGLSTLTKWLGEERLSGVQPDGRNGAVPFQEVNLRPPFSSPGWAAEVALTDGAVLRLNVQTDPAWVAELLPALRQPC